ncbi:MAG: flagellar protein [Acetatifactor sp.]
MNIRNCRSCGKIFNYITGIPICPMCREKMEAKFQEVKEYIREHKGAGISQVAEACDVEPAQIQQWLREERLEVTEDSALFLNCDVCGAPIRSGKYCEKCKLNMTRELKDVMHSARDNAARPGATGNKSEGNARMRFL